MHYRPAIPAVFAGALLASCANPQLEVRGAGFSVNDSPSLTTEPASMAESMAKLNHVRATYHEAIRRQRATSINATIGLTWLGAAIIGAAYGKASEPWIVGSALIGGTTYGLTRAQLDARQVELWQQGIEALDCARRASLPLDIGAARQSAITKRIEDLVAARDAVDAQASAVTAELDKLPRAQVPNVDLVDKAVRSAMIAVADSDTARGAALSLLDVARGRELSSAIDRVDAQIVRATESIAIDVSSVKPLIAGIGGFASIFVPGIDATLGQSLVKWNANKPAPGSFAPQSGRVQVDTSALDAAMDRLAAAMRTLSARQSSLKALIGSVDTAAVNEALKGCNVTGVATALLLQPAFLEFIEKKADGKGVSISGGKPPYEVSLLDPVAGDTVVVVFSGGMSDRMQVKVTAGVTAGTYTVGVKDSSTSHRVITLPVTVAPAPAPAPATPKVQAPSPPVKPGSSVQLAPPKVVAPASGAAPAPAPNAGGGVQGEVTPLPSASVAPAEIQALWVQLSTALRAAPPISVSGGASVSVTNVTPLTPAQAKPLGGLTLTLTCTQPVDPGKPAQAAIKEALSRVNPQAYAQLQGAGAIDRATASQIVLKPTQSCFR